MVDAAVSHVRMRDPAAWAASVAARPTVDGAVSGRDDVEEQAGLRRCLVVELVRRLNGCDGVAGGELVGRVHVGEPLTGGDGFPTLLEAADSDRVVDRGLLARAPCAEVECGDADRDRAERV